jgi:hypothetical protein
MGKYAAEAARCNAILQSAASLLNGASTDASSALKPLEGNMDVITSCVNSSCANIGAQISGIIGQLASIQAAISAKAAELDEIERQKELERQKIAGGNQNNVIMTNK